MFLLHPPLELLLLFFLIVVLGTKCLVKNKRKLQKHTCVSCTHASTFASDLNVQKCYSKRLVEAQNRRV
jgi:hypothetical protein